MKGKMRYRFLFTLYMLTYIRLAIEAYNLYISGDIKTSILLLLACLLCSEGAKAVGLLHMINSSKDKIIDF